MALTDHNTCGNCRAFSDACAAYDILALPGMELTTAEEVHVVCLFPDHDRAEAFSAHVRSTLPPIANKKDIFGPQILMDSGDGVLGEETAFLAGASGIGIYQAAELVKSYGGFAFPAHIDRPSFALIANLGLWDPMMGFSLAELSRNCPADFPARPDLRGVRLITDCDAHYLDQIPDAHQYMELGAKTAQAVLDWLRGPT